jgi:predicted O-methyltransferase YrrM
LTEKNIQELAHTISLVARIDVKQSRAYIDEIRGDRELASHIRATLSADKSMSDSTMLLGRRIGWYALIRSLKPKTVVETGVHQGIGAVTIIRALEKNSDEGFPGKYFGTDIDPDAGVLITGSFLATGKVLYGDSIETLNQFTAEIDVFVNDSDHSADYEAREYEVVQTKLAKSAVILGDNSHATSSLVDFSFKNNRDFVLFREEPKDHWYPGAGIGISY